MLKSSTIVNEPQRLKLKEIEDKVESLIERMDYLLPNLEHSVKAIHSMPPQVVAGNLGENPSQPQYSFVDNMEGLLGRLSNRISEVEGLTGHLNTVI